MNKIITAAVAALGIAASAPASAIIVGGIDFGPDGAVQHLETATLAETFVNGVGQTLTGYGHITTVNGDTSYCADGSNNCALYYTFSYLVSGFNPAGSVTFSGGVVDIYYGNSVAMNLLNADSPTNLALITAMDPWVRLVGHTFSDGFFNVIDTALGNLNPDTYTLNGFGQLTGATLSQTGAGQLDVDLGGTFGLASVAAYLDGNSEPDGLGGFADITLTSSSNNSRLNTNDVANGYADSCQTAPVYEDWCLQGTLDVRGATSVPEPSVLALLGLGLLGLGLARRNKRA